MKSDVDCTTKIRILKQITTVHCVIDVEERCRLHHKDTNFKANHNVQSFVSADLEDVDCTTKIRILKQITTHSHTTHRHSQMSIAPQIYEF